MELASDTLLLQLHAIFGSMLMSALQLVDRREVVRVSLPGGRTVHQVTSSTGLPYTLYLNLPKLGLTIPATHPLTTLTTDFLTTSTIDPLTTDPPTTSKIDPPEADIQSSDHAGPSYLQREEGETSNHSRIIDLASSLRGLYCPCPGFAYNSLSGPGNPLCKHLLAVIIASRMGKEIMTAVGLEDVMALLGIDVSGSAGVKEEPVQDQ
ncbi:hypothetical protein BCR39DRAFT_545763 [Naematelia encephala]|uniref:SWIM-type domain-containing protein n=1 Tax=Naematelia encephala TaxID=71784 RepID=A0A1Y2AQD0_9TREE|nr:hypothetical protein BCR39DRAFT_545763 [Naematelia encephala]